MTTHTHWSEAKQCRYMWIYYSRHLCSWYVDFSIAISFQSTVGKNVIYLYCQGKLSSYGHKKTTKWTKAFDSFSLKNLRIIEKRYSFSFFKLLQVADVKASFCHGGMPGDFIVIAGLLSCSWCPYDCVTTHKKKSWMTNKLHRYSLRFSH